MGNDNLLQKGSNTISVNGKEAEVAINKETAEFYFIESIRVRFNNLPFKAYADDLVERLNSGQCPVGKKWAVLENAPYEERIVSDTFERNHDSYRYYEIVVNKDELCLDCYKMRKGKYRREKVDFKVAKGDLESLLESLIKKRRSFVYNVLD